MRRSYSRTRRRQEATGRCFDRPSPGQHLEAGGGVNTAQHFDGEIKENGLVKQLPTIVAAVLEKMLDPWPALADSVEDHLRADVIRDRLQGRKVLREHTPAAARAIALRTSQVNVLPTASLGWFRQQLQSAPMPHWRDRSDYTSSSARFGPSSLASLVSTT